MKISLLFALIFSSLFLAPVVAENAEPTSQWIASFTSCNQLGTSIALTANPRRKLVIIVSDAGNANPIIVCPTPSCQAGPFGIALRSTAQPNFPTHVVIEGYYGAMACMSNIANGILYFNEFLR